MGSLLAIGILIVAFYKLSVWALKPIENLVVDLQFKNSRF